MWRKISLGVVSTILAVAVAVTVLTAAPTGAQQSTPQIASAASIDSAPLETPPNFLVLVTDDQSRHEFNRETMPNLFRLIVDEGAIFDEFTVNTPVCGPSRATLLTGRYPHNHGVQFCDTDPESFKKWDAYFENGWADNDAGSIFQRSGYRTSMIGRYVNSYGQDAIMRSAFGERGHEQYLPSGWDDFWVPLTLAYQQFDVVDGENYIEYGTDEPAFRTDIEFAEAIGSLDDAADSGRPFMTHLWVGAPHSSVIQNEPTFAPRHEDSFEDALAPRLPNRNEADFSDKPDLLQGLGGIPDSVLNVFDNRQRSRLRSLQAVDEGIADVIAQLERRGQLENTYVIFVSDNGFHLGQHRLRSKMAPYEDSVNVPMAIRGPGIDPGQEFDQVVSMVDILPTMMDLAGEEIPSDIDGQSFAHILTGDGDAFRDQVLVEHWTQHPSQYANPNDPSERVAIRFEYQMLRSPTEVYIRWHTGDREYYDLRSDPYQLENGIDRLDRSTRRGFEDELDALVECEGEQCHRWGNESAPTSLGPRQVVQQPGAGIDLARPELTSAAPIPGDLLSPAAGETFEAGDTIQIDWATDEIAGSQVHVRLESREHGSVVIAQSIANTGSFEWLVPADVGDSEYRLVVSSLDNPELRTVAHDVQLFTGVNEPVQVDNPPVEPAAPHRYCGDELATVFIEAGETPTPFSDVILGTPSSDVINAGAGDDRVCGFGGNDVVDAGAGDDVVFGGLGDDLLVGAAGDDALMGGAGIDELRGGAGADVILGGPGSDALFGFTGPDELSGGGAADVIYGGDGADLLWGGPGADELFGGNGADEVFGDQGDDLLVVSSTDISDGGNGQDRCRGSGLSVLFQPC